MATAVNQSIKDNLASAITDANEKLAFTDNPCAAMMKNNQDIQAEAENSDDVTGGLLSFCGGLDQACFFADVKDADEEDAERLKSMSAVKESAPNPAEDQQPPPMVTAADTESVSDDSGPKEAPKEDAAPTEDSPVPKEVDAVKPEEPQPEQAKSEDKVEEVKEKQEEAPPAQPSKDEAEKVEEDKPDPEAEKAVDDFKRHHKGWLLPNEKEELKKHRKSWAKMPSFRKKEENPKKKTGKKKEDPKAPKNSLQARKNVKNDSKPHNALQAAKLDSKKKKKYGWFLPTEKKAAEEADKREKMEKGSSFFKKKDPKTFPQGQEAW